MVAFRGLILGLTFTAPLWGAAIYIGWALT